MKNKTIAYGAAGVVTYLTVDYLYTQISNSIKESFNRKLRHARNVGWSNGFDDGYHQGRLSTAMTAMAPFFI